MESESESEVTQSCLTLSDPMDCSLPGSSIHGVFQARVLEWGDNYKYFSPELTLREVFVGKNFLSLQKYNTNASFILHNFMTRKIISWTMLFIGILITYAEFTISNKEEIFNVMFQGAFHRGRIQSQL